MSHAQLDAKPLMAARDTSESEFGSLMDVAAALFAAPMASLSLMESGVPSMGVLRGFDRADALSTASEFSQLSLGTSIVQIEDAREDARFATKSWVVHSPFIRFLVSAPVIDSTGEITGRLCVMDSLARTASSGQLEGLRTIARAVADLAALRRANVRLQREVMDLADRCARLARLEEMVKASPHILAVVDKDGVTREVVFPRDFQRTVPPQTHIGRLFAKISDEIPPALLESIREAIVEGRQGSHSFTMNMAAGFTRFEVEVTRCGQDEALLVGRDVTKAYEFDRMKSEFLSMIAHEIRTPLSAVHGSLSLLDGGVCGPLSTDQKEMISISLQSADRLRRLVTDVLDLERLSQGNFELIRVETDPCELVRDAVREVAVLAKRHEIELVLELDTGFVVQCDRDRMTQSLVNLLGNALRFSPLGGRVTVRVDASGPQRVRIGVRDSGPGLDPAARERVFQKFETDRQPSRTEVKPTGLGLAIVAAIMQQHGGVVGVESETAEGATFFLEMDGVTPSMEQLTARWERDAMALLKRDLIAAIGIAVIELRETLSAVRSGSATEEQLQSALRLARRYAETADPAGFEDVGVRARLLESLLKDPRPTSLIGSPALAKTLTDFLEACAAIHTR